MSFFFFYEYHCGLMNYTLSECPFIQLFLDLMMILFSPEASAENIEFHNKRGSKYNRRHSRKRKHAFLREQ